MCKKKERMRIVAFICCFHLIVVCTAQTIRSKTIDLYRPTEVEDARNNYNLGNSYLNEEQYSLAIIYFQKAIEQDSLYVDAYDNLGVCYRRSGDLNTAIECYEKSLDIFPEGIIAHQNLAIIYYMLDVNEKAINEYRAIIKLQPNNPEGYYGLCNIYMNQGRLSLALSNGLKAEELYSNSSSSYVYDAQYLIGKLYYFLGKSSKAKKYIQKALAGGISIESSFLSDLKLNN